MYANDQIHFWSHATAGDGNWSTHIRNALKTVQIPVTNVGHWGKMYKSINCTVGAVQYKHVFTLELCPRVAIFKIFIYNENEISL